MVPNVICHGAPRPDYEVNLISNLTRSWRWKIYIFERFQILLTVQFFPFSVLGWSSFCISDIRFKPFVKRTQNRAAAGDVKLLAYPPHNPPLRSNYRLRIVSCKISLRKRNLQLVQAQTQILHTWRTKADRESEHQTNPNVERHCQKHGIATVLTMRILQNLIRYMLVDRWI